MRSTNFPLFRRFMGAEGRLSNPEYPDPKSDLEHFLPRQSLAADGSLLKKPKGNDL